MKGVVAFGFFLLFLAALALVNLSKRVPAERPELRAPTAGALISDRWQLVALRGAAGARQASIEMQFTPGGMLSGNGRCRFFTANYLLNEANLTFQDIDASPSSCPDETSSIESSLLEVLNVTTGVGSDGRNLVLLGNDNARLARFVPMLPARQ